MTIRNTPPTEEPTIVNIDVAVSAAGLSIDAENLARLIAAFGDDGRGAEAPAQPTNLTVERI